MNKAVTVSRLNAYIKMVLGNDEYLSNVLVTGEISNFKHHQSGHLYFTLKDAESALSCVMFQAKASLLDFRPEDGMEIVASGYVSVFERTGRYQLYVQAMIPGGEGALYRQFEELKKKLAAEGLFDEAVKKPIPMIPGKIGVVTSETGSVIKDILNVLDRRYPIYNLELYPAHVQGRGAEKEIAAGIRYFNRKGDTDVIIIARGGGSIEDLWPFNEEYLARAIYESRIPVVSAVGHETDYTIADFVSDRRAPTPSAAAELVVPELTALMDGINNSGIRLRNHMRALLERYSTRVRSLADRPVMKRPGEIFNMTEMVVERLSEKLEAEVSMLMERKEADLKSLAGKIELLSPVATLVRGYSVLKDNGGHVITSLKAVGTGDRISAVLSDGRIDCEVKGKETKDAKEIL
ncbi:MAG TPA: exodeoxyribonuclease VII large subunit [Clostridia bacterium]|nr:exodeoxyribonuclease VII large subunit [Clostridia bacterium]HRX42488.1 exodeoxyribonuclease VII large subunit [Clostridia bacterium]